MRQASTLIILGLLSLSGTAALAAGIPSSADSVSKGDRQILDKLASGSVAEIEFGNMIAGKSTEPNVQAFARKMVTDHSMLLADAKDFAKTNSVTLDTNPPQDAKQAMNDTSRLTGQSMDRSYIQGMLADHKKDVAEVAHYIAKNPSSSAAPLLKKALTVMEDHLRIAENVAGQIGVPPDAGLTRQSAGQAGD